LEPALTERFGVGLVIGLGPARRDGGIIIKAQGQQEGRSGKESWKNL